MATARVIVGDCRGVMAGMEAESVDAICTDPPYGLEFMGRDWDKLGTVGKQPKLGKPTGDPHRRHTGTPSWGANGNPTCKNCGGDKYRNGDRKCSCDAPDFGNHAGEQSKAMQAWHETWAREAFRVLRPGGHLVAFGGTRTFHRLACAIEDAGFEIRDCLSWLYGSGFPKSLDVAKAMDKARGDNPQWQAIGSWLRQQREAKGLGQKDVATLWPSVTGGLTGCVANWELGFNFPKWDQWVQLKQFIGFGDEMDAEVWRLNGRKGQPGEAWFEREVVGEWNMPGRGKRSEAQAYGLTNDSGTITAPATDLARQWDGWGTALKPAWEPIVLARKPLSGTVAANVARFGTGAINVDGCRIGTDVMTESRMTQSVGGVLNCNGRDVEHGNWEQKPNDNPKTSVGRWPPNVGLSHSPECRPVGVRRVKTSDPGRSVSWKNSAHEGWKRPAHEHYEPMAHGYADPDGTELVDAWECADSCPIAELDRQSGACGDTSAKPRRHNARPDRVFFGQADRVDRVTVGYGDTGGASRFMATFAPDDGARFRYVSKASRRERQAGLPEGVTGDHPTRKPVALLRWLVRLVVPPGGTCLDPFLGSGSTGVACVLEGFDFIGIDQDPHYVNDLAAPQIAHAERWGERWLEMAGRAPKRTDGGRPDGALRSNIPRCSEHDEPLRPQSGTYACGCKIVYVPRGRSSPPKPAPALSDLPLFAEVAD